MRLFDFETSHKMDIPIAQYSGRVISANSNIIVARGCKFLLNQHCKISTSQASVDVQVISVDENKAYLMPFDSYSSIAIGDKVTPLHSTATIAISHQWLGRVINAKACPIDNKGELLGNIALPIYSDKAIPTLHRKPITDVLDVGVRAINSLLTLGKGQRIGLVANSGVGKSVLLGMMAKYTKADVVVVGLIGERNREVQEFIDHVLGPEGLKKAVVIASPANESPLMRIQATHLCHTVAEHFRDEGKNVLLMVDSLTRFAMAQREVAISRGDLPAIKGYPPSVFAHIPPLLERSGNGLANSEGSMTAIYTLLSEGDQDYDPVVDSAKSILDGHIVLSKELAQEGHYPAIDIERSISRCMNAITNDAHIQCARECKRLYSLYQKSKDLIALGGYQSGNDPDLDQAILKQRDISTLLQQAQSKGLDFSRSLNDLAHLFK